MRDDEGDAKIKMVVGLGNEAQFEVSVERSRACVAKGERECWSEPFSLVRKCWPARVLCLPACACCSLATLPAHFFVQREKAM